MSVIVKCMDMPRECQYCPMCRYYPNNGNTWCNATNKLLESRTFINIANTKPEWCPLVEFPENCSTCKHYNRNDRNTCIQCTDSSMWEMDV